MESGSQPAFTRILRQTIAAWFRRYWSRGVMGLLMRPSMEIVPDTSSLILIISPSVLR